MSAIQATKANTQYNQLYLAFNRDIPYHNYFLDYDDHHKSLRLRNLEHCQSFNIKEYVYEYICSL